MTTTLFALLKREEEDNKEEEEDNTCSDDSSSPPQFERRRRGTLNLDNTLVNSLRQLIIMRCLKKKLRCGNREVILCADDACEMFKKGGIANNECDEMFFKALLLIRENGEV